MNSIYEPAGRAREYSPLALNIFQGCDHDCDYCYVKKIPFIKSSPEPKFRAGLIEALEKECLKHKHTAQVLLSFMSDPYCKADEGPSRTRKVLEVLNRHNINTAVLTKGGKRCLRDLDLFQKFKKIKVGATLTCLEDSESLTHEPGAALPGDRIETLKILHEAGVRTFASIEPVLAPETSLDIIRRTIGFVDIYKVGKLNHHENKTDWKAFGEAATEVLSKAGKAFYLKNDLAAFMDEKYLKPENRNPDIFDVP